MRPTHVAGTLALPRASKNCPRQSHVHCQREDRPCSLLLHIQFTGKTCYDDEQQLRSLATGSAHLQHVRLVDDRPVGHERAAVRGCTPARCLSK